MLTNGNNIYVPYLQHIAYNYNHTKHGTTDEIPAVLHSGIGIPHAATKIQLYADRLLLKHGYKPPKNLLLQRGDWV